MARERLDTQNTGRFGKLPFRRWSLFGGKRVTLEPTSTAQTKRDETPTNIDTVAKKEGPRLPTNYTVDTYKYRQTPNFDDLTFEGQESVVMTVTEPSKELTLNALGLNVQSAQFKTIDGQIYPATVAYDEEQQRVTFGFDNQLQGKGELDLSFTGDFKDKKGEVKGELNGTYLAKWEDADGKPHYWATSQYEPTDARRALVLADEPDRKAQFEVTLVTPKGWGAISNMREREVYEENGKDVHVFSPTPKMSSYLLANIVGEFDIIEDTDQNGILHRVVTTPGKGEQGKAALETSMKVLPFYEEWTEVAFPLDKQDNIAVPEFEAGAMENWGAITYREARVLVDPQNSSQATKEGMLEVVGHEEAHMWFGNLVSPKWWTYLWLNESFATYMSYLASDHVHPEWNVWDNFVDVQQNPSLYVDGLKNTHPIEVEVNHPKEIDEIFDTISYHKGCSILDMLSHYIGAENFRKGTSNYLKEYANGNATTQDLLRSYEETSGRPVREVMENWLYKPGYPVVIVREDGDYLTLSQERFFISERSRQEAEDSTVWQIPLIIHEAGQTPGEFLMKDKNTRVFRKGQNGWFIVNEGANSFARVDYPESVLQSLREPIEKQQISPADRYALIRDSFDLAQGGVSSVDKALAFVDAYKNETNFTVWSAIAERLGNVANIIDGESPEIQAKFDNFAQSLFRPVVERLGWEKKPGESNKDAFLRELAIANLGQYGDVQTIRTAHEKFDAYISGETSLDPDLRSAVYKIVAAHGTADDYEKFMDLYRRKTTSQEEKVRILTALGAFSNPDLTERTLQFALPEEGKESAPKADAYRLMASLFRNPKARERAWEFTKDNWEKILDLYGEGQLLLPRFIAPAAEFHSMEKATDVESFFASHDAPGAQRMIQQVVELITSKADWLARDREKILGFLNTTVESTEK